MTKNIQVFWRHMKHKVKSSQRLTSILLKIQVFHTLRHLKKGASGDLFFAQRAYRCHLLLLNKADYVFLAQICVSSFLRYHPNSTFILHVDSRLINLTQKKFKDLIKIEILEIVEAQNVKSRWQREKLEIILNMQGPSEIFMDADLRWNGPLPNLEFTSIYLKEFSLSEYEIYKTAFSGIANVNETSMYNLSFFSSNGQKFTNEEVRELLETEELIANLSSGGLSEEQLGGVRRMSEQLAISIFLDKYGRRVVPLKLVDERNDGAFVESCYFGATGLIF